MQVGDRLDQAETEAGTLDVATPAVEALGQPGIAGFVGLAQQHLDPSGQFDQREGFGKVVVAAFNNDRLDTRLQARSGARSVKP